MRPSALEWKASATTPQACPVCAASGGRQVLIARVHRIDEPFHVFRCPGCSSLFYDDQNRVENYNDLGGFFWQYYAEVGVGIEAMIRPVVALGPRARGSLLDVGCGLGYLPDFWQRSGRGDAVGLEPASYGRMGREILGATVYSDGIVDCAELSGRQFDIVYASEVIEHVRAPLQFLRDMVGKLKPGGLLVLTTPCADYISPDQPASHVMALLSPGFHYFLLSRRSLRDLIAKAGLRYCTIKVTHGRLMAWASHRPLPTISLDAFDWDEYFDYLTFLGSNPNETVAGGALYMLFKDSLNTGHTERAKAAFSRLSSHAARYHNLDPLDISLKEVVATPTLERRLNAAPAWLGGALLFGGILNEIEGGSPERSCRSLSAATLLLEHDVLVGDQFSGEAAAFLPAAKTEYNKALQRTFSSTTAPRRANDLCFFAHHDRNGLIADHVVAYVQELQASNFDVVFVTTSNPSATELEKIAAYAFDIIVRDNIGYDFGSWAAAYLKHAVRPHQLLLLCNDSVYGPLWSLKKTLKKLVGTEADFYGMVISNEHVPHVQSWFMLFTPRAHQSPAFKDFMATHHEINSKLDAIQKIELRLTKILESNGLRPHALYNPRTLGSAPRIASNPTHFLWRQLIGIYGVPFIKIELLRDNPMKLNLASVPRVLRRRSNNLPLDRMPYAKRPRRAAAFRSISRVYHASVLMDDFWGRNGWSALQDTNMLFWAFVKCVASVRASARFAAGRFAKSLRSYTK